MSKKNKKNKRMKQKNMKNILMSLVMVLILLICYIFINKAIQEREANSIPQVDENFINDIFEEINPLLEEEWLQTEDMKDENNQLEEEIIEKDKQIEMIDNQAIKIEEKAEELSFEESKWTEDLGFVDDLLSDIENIADEAVEEDKTLLFIDDILGEVSQEDELAFLNNILDEIEVEDDTNETKTLPLNEILQEVETQDSLVFLYNIMNEIEDSEIVK